VIASAEFLRGRKTLGSALSFLDAMDIDDSAIRSPSSIGNQSVNNLWAYNSCALTMKRLPAKICMSLYDKSTNTTDNHRVAVNE